VRVWPGRGRIDRAWCAPCEASFARPTNRCKQCSLRTAPGITHCADCQQTAPNWSLGAAAVDYAYPWRGLISAYKSGTDVGLGHGFARLMTHNTGTRAILTNADGWVGIPLTPAKLARRGFHQIHDLMNQLQQQLKRPPRILRGALEPLRHASAQKTLNLRERMGNIHQLFTITKGTHDLRGLHLVVIDDVSTTGATLHAATAVLLKAGAASVNVVAFARTPKPDG